MIPGLDGLRAIAFLLVFLHHTDYTYFGWTGVLLFFVLSGFLITGILLKMKESLPSLGTYLAKFYGRRSLRIFPLYYFYLALFAVLTSALAAAQVYPGYMQKFWAHFPHAFFYLYDFFYASPSFEHYKLLDHFWSLSVEEQFYLVWPLLLWFTPRRHLKTLFLAGIFAAPLFRLGLTYLIQTGNLPFFNAYAPAALYPLPFSHIDAFAMGAYLSQYRPPRPRLQFFALLLLLPLLGYGTEYLATNQIAEPTALGFMVPLANAYKQVWGYSLLNYFFTITLALVVYEKAALPLLELPALRYLGKISYGMYVYHFALTWFAGRLQDFFPLDFGTMRIVIPVVSFSATLLLASASYRWLEKPFLNQKDRLFPLKQEKAPHAQP
jgi:peptidoglycan/LPS O-acetylase OafA/YrhL